MIGNWFDRTMATICAIRNRDGRSVNGGRVLGDGFLIWKVEESDGRVFCEILGPLAFGVGDPDDFVRALETAAPIVRVPWDEMFEALASLDDRASVRDLVTAYHGGRVT